MAHTRIGSDGYGFSVSGYNGMLTAIEAQSVYLFGTGVVSGCLLSDPNDGLNVRIASGVINVKQYKAIVQTDAVAPDDATSYVWISEAGTVSFSATSAHPGGDVVCLGTVTTSGGNVTAVDNTATTGGRMYPWVRETSPRTYSLGGGLIQVATLTGYIGIGKTPSEAFGVGVAAVFDSTVAAVGAGTFGGLTIAQQVGNPATLSNKFHIFAKDVSGTTELYTKDEGGTVRKITTGGIIAPEVNSETLSADKTGAASDALIQALDPNGAHRKYILPAAVLGVKREIHNTATSGAFNILVRNPADSTTVATVANGERVTIEARIGGSYGASADYASGYTPDP